MSGNGQVAPETNGDQGDEIWLPNTSPIEAVNWARRRFENWTISFVVAVRKRDAALLDECCKHLRHVVTRLDAYRRIKAREWAEQGVPQSENHSGDSSKQQ